MLTAGISNRLLSLDVFRGITVSFMILVNNDWGDESFEMLLHSKWNGMTPCDLVFPFFIFIMGVSCYLSFDKSDFDHSPRNLFHILKRTIVLFVAGLIVNWAFLSVRESPYSIEHLRIWGPLQRIGICYGLLSLFALYLKHKYIIPAVITLLTTYAIILIMGHGYVYDANDNILSIVDMKLFGYEHIYHRSPVDPEGLLGIIPSLAHSLIGFYCGQIISQKCKIDIVIIRISILGTVLIFCGFLLSYGLPLNKRIWSPSFVLVSCGFASLLFSSLIYILDDKKKKVGVTLFRAFGVNALALYIISLLLLALLMYVGLTDWWYGFLHRFIVSLKWSSLFYAISWVALFSGIALLFYRYKVIVKI